MAPSGTNKPQGGFFALKQVGLFAGMALLILVVDIFLYVAIAMFEANASYYDGTDPNSTESEGRVHVSDVADALSQDTTGAWVFNDDEIEQALSAKKRLGTLGKRTWRSRVEFQYP